MCLPCLARGTFLTEAEVAATGTRDAGARSAVAARADSLLQIVPKKGVYVPPITEAEIEAVMQARGVVEEWCVRQAAGFGDACGGTRQADVPAGGGAATPLRSRMRPDFHRRYCAPPVIRCSPTSMRARGPPVADGVCTSSQTSGGAGDSVLAEHAAIVEGIRRGQPEQAAASVAEHLARTLVALRLPVAAGWGSAATVRRPAVAAQ